MSVISAQIKPEILNQLIPEFIKISDSVRTQFLRFLHEELDIVLELATELDERKINVNELRCILSLRGVNICF